MDFDYKDEYPEFLPVAEHIRMAHAERSIYIAHLIATGVAKLGAGLRHVARLLDAPEAAELERRAVVDDLFVKRAVARY